MPNIEVHGFSETEAKSVRERVFKLFEGKPYVREMVVAIYLTVVEDFAGCPQPFLRVCTTEQDYVKEILALLPSLGIDIEHMRLVKFIPKSG